MTEAMSMPTPPAGPTDGDGHDATCICKHCESTVPAATFCGACGGHLHSDGGRHRLFAFAASPTEPLLRLSLFSTLFAQLPHRHTHRFRDGLVLGTLLVGLLIWAQLTTPAAVVAIVILPVLYLLYLFEVEVFEHQPIQVIASTIGVGAVLGVGYQLVVGHALSSAVLRNSGTIGLEGGGSALLTELLMVLGPLLLISRSHFNQALDGVAFGVSSALGFTAAAEITSLWPLLTSATSVDLSSGTAILDLVRVGLVAPIVEASATGVIVTLYWASRHARSAQRHGSVKRDLLLLVGVLAVQIVLGVLDTIITSHLGLLVVWALAACLLLIGLRLAIHFALLGEVEQEMSASATACLECHAVYPLMHFCPNCGVHRSASPKRLTARPA